MKKLHKLLKLLKKAPAAVGHIYSLILIVLGWVLFYFEDLGELAVFVGRLFGTSGFLPDASLASSIISFIPLLIAAAVASTPLAGILYKKIKSKPVLCVFDNAACIAALLVCTAELVSSDYNPFLYFKF